jgi:hypothetical protein
MVQLGKAGKRTRRSAFGAPLSASEHSCLDHGHHGPGSTAATLAESMV